MEIQELSSAQHQSKRQYVQIRTKEILCELKKMYFYFDSGWTLAQTAQWLRSLHLRRHSKPEWTPFWTTCSGWPCFVLWGWTKRTLEVLLNLSSSVVSKWCFQTDSCGLIFEFQWWILTRCLLDSAGWLSCSCLWQEYKLKLSILHLWFTVKSYDRGHINLQRNGRDLGHINWSAPDTSIML